MPDIIFNTGPMGNNIIDRLKDEHKDLVKYVDALLEDPKNEEYLDILKDKLVKHLQTEEKELYSSLFKEAKKNDVVRLTLEVFHDDITSLSTQIKKYYKLFKSKSTGNDINLYKDEIVGLLVRLKVRIQSEEIVLFPMYERIIEQKN